MTHAEAVQELKRLAGDRAWSLQHETASYYDGGYQIDVFISGIGFTKGQTYRAAVQNMATMWQDKGIEELPPEVEDESQ